MVDFIKFLIENDAIWPATLVALVLGFIIYQMVKKSKFFKRIKHIEVAGQTVDFTDDDDDSSDSVAQKEIDKRLYKTILHSIINETVDTATERADIREEFRKKEKQFIKIQLSTIINVCVADYYNAVERDQTDALVFEKSFDKDMKDLFLSRLENELTKNLNTKNDDEIRTIVDEICSYAKSQMTLYLQKYAISHREDAKRIFESHLGDINSIIKECLVMIKHYQNEEGKTLKNKEALYNQAVDRYIAPLGEEKGEEWWPNGK